MREGTAVKVESALGERCEDLGELGEPTLPLFRECELVVDQDVELALLAFLHLGGVRCATQLGHETRGPFVVAVSDGAVEDADVGHGASLLAAIEHAPGVGVGL